MALANKIHIFTPPSNYFNPYKFIQFNLSKCSFNLGDWIKPWVRKDKGLGKNHCNMADEEGFDIGRDLAVFLASLLDKTEYICQNDEGEGAAEAHAEGIDQSIRML